MTLRGLIHAHSSHSFDSLLPPRAYLAYAQRAKLDFLCLTDHNTIAGALALARLNRNPGLEIVIGAEYATDQGDLIGLFLSEEIEARSWDGVIAAIRTQGGLVLLPHPYRNHRLDEAAWSEVDLVETFNARSSTAENEAATRDARTFGTREVAGADIHTLWELLRNRTVVTLDGQGDLHERLMVGPRSITTRASSPNLTRYSQLVKAGRRRLGFAGHR